MKPEFPSPPTCYEIPSLEFKALDLNGERLYCTNEDGAKALIHREYDHQYCIQSYQEWAQAVCKVSKCGGSQE